MKKKKIPTRYSATRKEPTGKVTHLKRGHLCEGNLGSGVEVYKAFGLSLATETQHCPWKRAETNPTPQRRQVLETEALPLCIYDWVCPSVCYFSNFGWKKNPDVETKDSPPPSPRPLYKQVKNTALSGYTQATRIPGGPCGHLESSGVTLEGTGGMQGFGKGAGQVAEILCFRMR